MQKPSENTGGLRSSAFKATPGPVMLDQGMLNNLGPAKVCFVCVFFIKVFFFQR